MNGVLVQGPRDGDRLGIQHGINYRLFLVVSGAFNMGSFTCEANVGSLWDDCGVRSILNIVRSERWGANI